MLCELSNTGLVKVSGIDAKKFLQGQLTCNLETITAEISSMGAHCNPQGRVISLFHLFLFQQSYYLLMPARMIPIAIKALKKYAIFFKAEISDASNEINQLLHHFPEKMPLSQQQNILEKIPALYPETSEKFLPHEINLIALNAVSFEKGCYTGQEIIARMHYRGKLKSQLYRAAVSTSTPPQPGQDIYSAQVAKLKPCGILVDAYHDVCNNKYLILFIANNVEEPLFLNQDKDLIHLL